MTLQASLDRLVAAELGRRHCHEIAFGVLQGDRLVSSCAGTWRGQDVTADTPFLIASTSKLLITTMVFQLVSEGRTTLDDAVARHFAGELAGLHRWRGQDLSGLVTVRHLLTHSSGLPDYFEGRRRAGGSLAQDLFAGRDLAFGLADVLRWVREDMQPAFAPGTGRKALYADTNFYLLTELVARLTGQDIGAALATRVTGPLGLTRTAFYRPGMAALPLRLRDQVLELPQALSSMPGDGGAVSTLADLAQFTSAFFAGRLFPRALLAELPDWRRVFFPLQAGTGVLRFSLPRWLPPFRTGLDFMGHSGTTGALAFACPAHRLIVVGTVNQLADPGRPYRLMIKAALAAGGRHRE
jgi:CubicO group peptidase (beta-lactamase class C family)